MPDFVDGGAAEVVAVDGAAGHGAREDVAAVEDVGGGRGGGCDARGGEGADAEEDFAGGEGARARGGLQVRLEVDV